MSLDRDIIRIYTDEIIALSETARAPKRLESPDLSARAVSPICGSEVEIEIALNDDGTIAALGYDSDACALTRTALAVLAAAAPGRTRDDIAFAGGQMRRMLEGGEPPDGAFSRLALLAPVKDFPARHNALLLPFEAVEKAFAKRKAGV